MATPIGVRFNPHLMRQFSDPPGPVGAVCNRTIGVNLVRLIHLSPSRGFGKSHLSTSGATGI